MTHLESPRNFVSSSTLPARRNGGALSTGETCLPTASPREGMPPDAGRPVVLLAGPLLAMEAPGGGEIQMLSLAARAGGSGGSRGSGALGKTRLAEADCLHLFGSRPEHLEIIAAARRCQIAGGAVDDHLVRPGAMLAGAAGGGPAAGFLRPPPGPARPARGSLWRRRLYESVDLLMPNSYAEAQQLIRYFGVPPRKIHVVPNGADLRFAQCDPQPFVERFGLRDFILYAGRIEPRKNQLGFLQAMRGSDVPIVVLGVVVPGHERYLAECRRAAGSSVTFVDRLEHGDPLLAGGVRRVWMPGLGKLV